MAWTKEQQLAIDKEHTNIIVSAGAGSGKTAVLTARVIRKLKSGTDINHLLILTFTKEAAKEMKSRIRKEINKIAELKTQLDLIDQAYITTFDSYALAIVKKYHYLLNMNKNVTIVDDSIIANIKKQIIDEIFDNLYEENNMQFAKLIKDFCTKDDENIKSYILKIYDKLDLKLQKEEYLNSYITNFYDIENLNNLVLEYKKLIERKKVSIDKLLEDISYLDSKYAEKLENVALNFIKSSSYDDIKKSISVALPNLPKNSDEELKNIKKQLSTEIKDLKSLIYKDDNEMLNEILLTKDYAEIIVNIIKKLDLEIQKVKSVNEIYEFVDIEKLAIQVIAKNPDILQEIKEYYEEIMVDEYQDTSDLQEEFISLIENHNVYMVGDIKQSIYRFRNANPNIFKNKYNQYAQEMNGFKIDLLKNFRSRNEVLAAINLIFNQCMDISIGGADYKDSHQMVFGNLLYENEGKTNQNNFLEIYNYDVEDSTFTKEEKEIFIIANDIKNKINNHYQVIDKDENILRDATYKDFCIILDRGSAFNQYKKIFEYLNIPLLIYKDEDLVSEDLFAIIKNIIGLMLKYIKKEFDAEYKLFLVSIARSFLISLDDNEIFNLFLEENFQNNIIIEKIKPLVKNVWEMNLKLILEQIIDQFQFYEKLILIGDIEKNIIRINELINLGDNLNNLGYSLEDFYDYLEAIKDNDNGLKYNLTDTSSNSVKIMNIHKSKGLEFPVCYYAGLHKLFNKSDLKDRILLTNDYQIILPVFKEGLKDTILKTLMKEKNNIEEISEKIRLFYVALTRAREKIIMVTNLSDATSNYKSMVDDTTRLKYNSFKNILDSVLASLSNYVVNIDLNTLNLTKDYNKINLLKYDNNLQNDNEKIKEITLNIDGEKIVEEHFSKQTHTLNTVEEMENMASGNAIHFIFETANFLHPNNEYVKKFIKHFDMTSAKIYKEYEFIKDGNKGVIDLMLEYPDEIKIVDYKLSNTNDSAYLNQLKKYQNYIQDKTQKKVNIYLYSIIQDKLILL